MGMTYDELSAFGHLCRMQKYGLRSMYEKLVYRLEIPFAHGGPCEGHEILHIARRESESDERAMCTVFPRLISQLGAHS